MDILNSVGNVTKENTFQELGYEFCRALPREPNPDVATKGAELREIVLPSSGELLMTKQQSHATGHHNSQTVCCAAATK